MLMCSLAHMFPNLWSVLAFYWNSLFQEFIIAALLRLNTCIGLHFELKNLSVM